MTTAVQKELESVIIRIAGDSGDGMQLTGDQLTDTSAMMGNDIATLPDFPAEIRAPQGTLPGVSSFQIQFSHNEVYTPGDAPDVLVVMNPAALKVNLNDLVKGGLLVVNTDSFNEDNLKKDSTTKLHQGFLEGSNVNPIGEMTRLIEATRAYESHMQAIKTYQEVDGKTVNDIARSK